AVELLRAEDGEHHPPIVVAQGLRDPRGLAHARPAPVAADGPAAVEDPARPARIDRLDLDAVRVLRDAVDRPTGQEGDERQLREAIPEYPLRLVLRQALVDGGVVAPDPAAPQPWIVDAAHERVVGDQPCRR